MEYKSKELLNCNEVVPTVTHIPTAGIGAEEVKKNIFTNLQSKDYNFSKLFEKQFALAPYASTSHELIKDCLNGIRTILCDDARKKRDDNAVQLITGIFENIGNSIDLLKLTGTNCSKYEVAAILLGNTLKQVYEDQSSN